MFIVVVKLGNSRERFSPASITGKRAITPGELVPQEIGNPF
jgi:hypothetical protein